MRGRWREGALGRWVASAEPVYEDARAGARERAAGIKAWCGFAVLRLPRTAFPERWDAGTGGSDLRATGRRGKGYIGKNKQK